MDKRLTWGPHITTKRQETNRRYRLLLKLLDNRSKLTLQNKRLIYNAILKPTWTYGIEIWGCAKPSHLKRIQSLQSIILRKISNSPFYVSNFTLHTDLSIPFVSDLTHQRYQKFHSRLPGHPNPHIHNLYSFHTPDSPPRHLKRRWPRDLL